jgi:protein-tyrosine phosphatase
MSEEKVIGVLFVCLGNICRSPMAEAVFRQMVKEAGLEDRFHIESAGTGSWHVGERPHRGTIAVLQQNEIDIGAKRGQQLSRSAMSTFDYIIAMDTENVSDIQSVFGKRVPRLLEFAPPSTPQDVPDPYYSGGFDYVYQLVQAGCRGLLAHIREKENL